MTTEKKDDFFGHCMAAVFFRLLRNLVKIELLKLKKIGSFGICC